MHSKRIKLRALADVYNIDDRLIVVRCQKCLEINEIVQNDVPYPIYLIWGSESTQSRSTLAFRSYHKAT